MKKLVLSVSSLLMVSNVLFSQWQTRVVEGLENNYNIAYCDSKETESIFVKLEKSKENVLFYINGVYCESEIKVNVDLLVNLKWQEFEFTAIKSDYSNTLFICIDITTSSCFDAFKKAESMILTINDMTCGYQMYTFPMTNSTKSYNFVLNQ